MLSHPGPLPKLLLAAAGIALFASPADAQSAPSRTSAAPAISAPSPTFDVAAIRQNVTANRHTHNSIWSSPRDGNFRASNVPLKMLIEFAYDIPDTRILDGPDWINSETFDIEAKADPSVDVELGKLTSDEGKLEKERMLQALLADRFGLKVHRETRELPIYALVVAKGGPKFLASKDQGTTVNRSNGRIEVSGGDSTVGLLAEQLSKVTGRDVVDRTGLTGRYNMTLRWTPDDSPPPRLNGEPDTSAPSLFTAIQEQLGLKLDAAKAPVSVLVIDQVTQPTAN